MTDYIDLCARWEEFRNRTPQIASTLILIDNTLAAIRELEAQKRELALDVIAAGGQAQEAYQAQLAAEAKLAEVERELRRHAKAEYPQPAPDVAGLVEALKHVAELSTDFEARLEARAALAAIAAVRQIGGNQPTEYERKVAQMKKDFPNGI